METLMETLREKFKKFVLSEESLFNFNILIDEFDFTIPHYIESFYHELFVNPLTSRKIKDSYIKITLELPIIELGGEYLFFNALFEMATLKEIKFVSSINYKKQIQELYSPFNIFFALLGNINCKQKDFVYFEELKKKYKFGWFKLRYDDVLFFPLEDFVFSYKNMKVL
jgi:hypothetical protein